MNPARIDPRESMQKTRRGWIGAGGFTQGSRGPVLVQDTCGWDILAAVVMRRHQEAHSGHLGSPELVLLWAHETNQRGRRRGSDS